MCRNKKINNIKYQVLLVPTDLFAVCTTCPKTCFPTHSLRTNSLASHARGSSSVAAEFWVGRRPRQRRQMRIQDRIRLRQIPSVGRQPLRMIRCMASKYRLKSDQLLTKFNKKSKMTALHLCKGRFTICNLMVFVSYFNYLQLSIYLSTYYGTHLAWARRCQ